MTIDKYVIFIYIEIPNCIYITIKQFVNKRVNAQIRGTNLFSF